MKLPAVALCMLAIGATSASAGTIGGALRDPDGPVANATVQARNLQSGELRETRSDGQGYTLIDVPAGTYEIVVPALGWRTERFVKTGVRIGARQTIDLDIELKRSNLGVVGDDAAYLAMINKYGGIEGAVPRTASGRPDLSGVWLGHLDPNPAKPELLPWAAKELERRDGNHHQDSPSANCLPDPIPVTPDLHKFVQTDSLLLQITEGVPPLRQVFLDGRPHPDDLDPTWTGHSVGHWEDDTLVVETTGFNDLSWLYNGEPHTGQLRIVERYNRTGLGRLNYDVTFEDAGALKAPWTMRMVWTLAPGEEIGEYICNENNDFHENTTAP